MGDFIIQAIVSLIGERAGEVIGVAVIAMIPVIELRGAIPIAFFGFGFSWQAAVICAIVGNMLPVPFVLLFLDACFTFMKRHNILTGMISKLEAKAISNSDRVSRLKFWGLVAFVAVPLPGTGAWTGSLVASVMKMDKKSSLLSVFIGVLGAAAIVTVTTLIADGAIGLFK